MTRPMIGDIYNWVKRQKSKFQVWRPPRLFSRLIQGIWWKKWHSRMKIHPRTLPRMIWKYNGKSIFWLFKILTETLQKNFWIEIWTFSFLKINFRLWEVVKLKIHVFAYTCIFSLTISRSWKLILKADLKWECPYFYSKFFFRSVSVNILKSQKMDFPLYFQILRGRVPGFIFMRECKFFHQMPCINLLNNRGGRQIWNFDFCLLTQL